MSILAIIQSRSNSSRLPYKSILPIANIPNTVLVAKRCSSKKYKTLVATSDNKKDDLLVKLLKKNNIEYFRGSEKNVKKRFLDCTKKYKNTDIIIRLTADNCLVDNFLIEKVLKEFLKRKKNYLFIDNIFSFLPYGISVEVFYLNLLRQKKKISNFDKEHVTSNFLKTHSNKFSYKHHIDLSHLRCTLDDLDDYLKILSLFKNNNNLIKLKWNKLCDYLIKLDKKKIGDIKPNKLYRKIVLGGAQFGSFYGITNKKKLTTLQIKEILNFSYKMGINQFDTASSYKKSEISLAYICKNEDVKIDTKVDVKKNIDLQINKSIKALKIKKINILYMHNTHNKVDKNISVLKALKKLKIEGKIKKIGLTIDNKKQFIESIKKYLDYLDVIQVPVNFFDQRWGINNIDKIKKKKIEIYARSIYLQGLLTESHDKWIKVLGSKKKEILDRINICVNKLGRLNLNDLSISFVKSLRYVDKYIIGVNSLSHLTENFFYFKEKPLTIDQQKYLLENFKNLPNKIIQPSKWKI